MTIANSEILFAFQIPTATNGPIKFGIVENSEYNDTPSERCSSGNASIIPNCKDIEKNAVHTPCITRATK
ncbi:Uncharacterised protein [Staphylococcus aureus]|nr:Uncharacterised protein [Staphylococcus aureus]SCU27767.1 Uncharacterised protein [Staphylococcus aureus]